jgi:methionyl-tRNA synthetase
MCLTALLVANMHLIGKDIVWFHTVIWPCMLFSANVPLPRTVFCHGFINGPDGKKMSKSLGNVVDPWSMLDKYAVDSFRFFLLREGSFGSDINFVEVRQIYIYIHIYK